MKNTTDYIMVWEDRSERWYYFINSFDEKQFTRGYVVYTITVDNQGKIISDNFHGYVGKTFRDHYDIGDWKTSEDITYLDKWVAIIEGGDSQCSLNAVVDPSDSIAYIVEQDGYTEEFTEYTEAMSDYIRKAHFNLMKYT